MYKLYIYLKEQSYTHRGTLKKVNLHKQQFKGALQKRYFEILNKILEKKMTNEGANILASSKKVLYNLPWQLSGTQVFIAYLNVSKGFFFLCVGEQ